MMFSRIFVECLFVCVVLACSWQVSSGAAVPLRHRLISRRSAGDKDCIKCPPGTYVTKACYSGLASLCKLCPSGTFAASPHLNTECQLCSQCKLGWYQAHACTRKRDTVCLEQNTRVTSLDKMQGDDPTTANNVQPTLGGDVIDTNGEEIVEKVVPDEVQLKLSPSDTPAVAASKGDGPGSTQEEADDDGEGSGDAEDVILTDAKPEENGDAAIPPETQTPAPPRKSEPASPDPATEPPTETPAKEPVENKGDNNEDAKDDDDGVPEEDAGGDGDAAVVDVKPEGEEERTAAGEDNLVIAPPEAKQNGSDKQDDDGKDADEDVDDGAAGEAEVEVVDVVPGEGEKDTGTTPAPESPQPPANDTAVEPSPDDDGGNIVDAKGDDAEKTPAPGTPTPTPQNATPLVVPEGGVGGDEDGDTKDKGDDTQPEDTAGGEKDGEAGTARGSIPGAVLKGVDLDQHDNETDVKVDDDEKEEGGDLVPMGSIPGAVLQVADQNATDADEGGAEAEGGDADGADKGGDEDDTAAEPNAEAGAEDAIASTTQQPANDTDDDRAPMIPVVVEPPTDLGSDDDDDDDKDADDDDKKTTDAGEVVVLSEPTGEASKNRTDDSNVSPPVVLEPSDDEKDDDDADGDGEKGDDALPITTTTMTSPSDDAEKATLSPVATTLATTAVASVPEPTPADGDGDDVEKGKDDVVVIVQPKEPAHPPSTTRRIPTLEEVDTTRTPVEDVIDIGSGDAPPLVVDGGEKGEEPEKEKDTEKEESPEKEPKPEKGEEPDEGEGSDKGEEPEKEDTEKEEDVEKEVKPEKEAEPEEGEESDKDSTSEEEKTGDEEEEDVVAIGEGNENETRELPGLPGDGTRRGDGQVVVLEEEVEEEVVDIEEDNETGPEIDARKGDTEEDVASKRRTALIVGVVIGAVALFTLGFFTSRHCKQRRQFKLMKKVPQDGGATNGREESIEFRPLHGSTGIYDEVDEIGGRSGQGQQGSYKKIKENNHSPVSSGPPPTSSAARPASITAPNGDTYAVVNKTRQPPHPRKINDPNVAPNERIPFIDESTDDERDEPKPFEKLLPKKPLYAALPEVQEEESRIQPPEPAPIAVPDSEPEQDVQPSVPGDIMRNADKKMANGGSGGKLGNDLPPSPKAAVVKNSVTRSRSIEVEV